MVVTLKVFQGALVRVPTIVCSVVVETVAETLPLLTLPTTVAETLAVACRWPNRAGEVVIGGSKGSGIRGAGVMV